MPKYQSYLMCRFQIPNCLKTQFGIIQKYFSALDLLMANLVNDVAGVHSTQWISPEDNIVHGFTEPFFKVSSTLQSEGEIIFQVFRITFMFIQRPM